jgi:hypothetical protein
MTLTSEIITDAYRQSNLLPIGTSPTVDQQNEALRYLNRIVKSVFGNEAGDPLQAFPVGRNNIDRPSGFPWYDTVPDNDWFVPKNTRAMLNLDAPISLYLHPMPDDGSRFAVIDVSENVSTNNCTVYGNGRLIEGANSITLSTDSVDKEWFYRADLGNWMLYSPLTDATIFPFPEEFDDYFITLLAMRLNPAYGVMIDAQSKMIFDRAGRQLRARYTQNIPTRVELGLIRMPKTTHQRYLWDNFYGYYDPSAMFDKGWPY